MIMQTTEAFFVEILEGFFIAPFEITDGSVLPEDENGYMLYIVDKDLRNVFIQLIPEGYQDIFEQHPFLMVYVSDHICYVKWHRLLENFANTDDLDTFFDEPDEEVWQKIMIPEKPVILKIVSGDVNQTQTENLTLAGELH